MSHARNGTTLMELVVAMVVTGMVAALGAATFNTVIDHRARAREATYAITSAAATRALLVSWLTGRITTQAERQQTSTSLNLGDDDDAVLVIATSSTPINSAETVIHLFIDRDEETPEKGLVAEMESIDLSSNDVQSTIARKVQLDSSVSGLLVELLDEQTRRWVPRREAATRWPIGIRVTLSARQPDTLPSLLRLPIVQAIPRGARGAPEGSGGGGERPLPPAAPPPRGPEGRGGRGGRGGGPDIPVQPQ